MYEKKSCRKCRALASRHSKTSTHYEINNCLHVACSYVCKCKRVLTGSQSDIVAPKCETHEIVQGH